MSFLKSAVFLCVFLHTAFGQTTCEPGNDCCAMGGWCGDAAFDECPNGSWDYGIDCMPSYSTCCVPNNPPTTTTTPAPTTTTGGPTTTGSGPTTTGSGPTTTAAPPGECGWRPAVDNVNADIVGGYESVAHSWPWMVSLELDYFGWGDWEHHCGASIIDNQWMLTAAHCVAKSGVDEPQYFRFIIGMHVQDQSGWTGDEIIMPVDSFYVHPQYDTEVDGANYDLCLLKIQTPLTYTDKMSPVCLPQNFDHEFLSEECFITGWGETQGTSPMGVLNESPINVITNDVCDTKWEEGAGEVGLIKPNHICAGNGVPGTCNGDSGGPLNCNTNGTWYIAGATSFGASGCVAEDAPDVYTRISHFLDWISTTMANN